VKPFVTDGIDGIDGVDTTIAVNKTKKKVVRVHFDNFPFELLEATRQYIAINASLRERSPSTTAALLHSGFLTSMLAPLTCTQNVNSTSEMSGSEDKVIDNIQFSITHVFADADAQPDSYIGASGNRIGSINNASSVRSRSNSSSLAHGQRDRNKSNFTQHDIENRPSRKGILAESPETPMLPLSQFSETIRFWESVVTISRDIVALPREKRNQSLREV